MLSLVSITARATAVDDLIQQWASETGTTGNAAQGAVLWTVESDQGRSCSQCHNADVTLPGKHITTNKLIDPMAPSVNPVRLTDVADVEKWLARNCRWTYGRACISVEKLDILTWLREQ